MKNQQDWTKLESQAIAGFHYEINTRFLNDIRDEIMAEKWTLPNEGPDHTTRRKNQSDYPGLTRSPRNLDDTHKFRDSINVHTEGKRVRVDFDAEYSEKIYQRADFIIGPVDALIDRRTIL